MLPLRRLISRLFLKQQPQQQMHPDYIEFLKMYHNGMFSKAYDFLRKGIENNAQWAIHSDCYMMLADLELKANNDIPRAKELLDSASKMGSFDKGYYYWVHSVIMWESGESEKAIQDLEKSIELDPNIIALTLLARLLLDTDNKRAMSIVEKVLEKEPDNCAAHILLAWNTAKSGDKDKALFMVKKVEGFASSYEDFSLLGSFYQDLEEYQQAISNYLESIKFVDDVESYAAIASCYCVIDNLPEGRRYLKLAKEKNQENAYLKEVQKWCEENFGKLDW